MADGATLVFSLKRYAFTVAAIFIGAHENRRTGNVLENPDCMEHNGPSKCQHSPRENLRRKEKISRTIRINPGGSS
jgi:hypothetical protein